MFGKNTYKEDIQQFSKISTTEAESLISTDKLAIIYIGRESCPFCRKFAKKLSNLTTYWQYYKIGFNSDLNVFSKEIKLMFK